MKFLFLGHVKPGEHRLVIDLNDEEAALLNGIAQALREQMGDKGPPPDAGAPVPAPKPPTPPPPAAAPVLGCPHGRRPGQPCPHCLGIVRQMVDTRRAPRPNPTRDQARKMGYTGDPCTECGQFLMVRNGTCLKCDGCGATSGCS